MTKTKSVLYILSLLLLAVAPLSADTDDHDDHDHIDEKYYHTHEGSDVAHDLTMALIQFETDKITDPLSQLVGDWELLTFNTTDHEMDSMVKGGTFDISFTVTEEYMQVSLVVKSNGKKYSDPPIAYTIEDGDIHIENADFKAGLKDGMLVYTMLGLDEAYRYTFFKK